jgi:anti-anti-sigma factor
MQQINNEINLEQHGAITLFNIQGDLTSFSEPILSEAYQSAYDQGAGKILLKIDREAYINSGGIAALIQILAQSKRNNQHIAITGVSNHFKKIFAMVGITRFADIHETVENALEVMS